MSTRIHGMTLEQFDRRVRNLPAQIQRASLRLANLKTEARRDTASTNLQRKIPMLKTVTEFPFAGSIGDLRPSGGSRADRPASGP